MTSGASALAWATPGRAVAGLAHDLDVVLEAEEGPQPIAGRPGGRRPAAHGSRPAAAGLIGLGHGVGPRSGSRRGGCCRPGSGAHPGSCHGCLASRPRSATLAERLHEQLRRGRLETTTSCSGSLPMADAPRCSTTRDAPRWRIAGQRPCSSAQQRDAHLRLGQPGIDEHDVHARRARAACIAPTGSPTAAGQLQAIGDPDEARRGSGGHADPRPRRARERARTGQSPWRRVMRGAAPPAIGGCPSRPRRMTYSHRSALGSAVGPVSVARSRSPMGRHDHLDPAARGPTRW